jgi:hypothetical protein
MTHRPLITLTLSLLLGALASLFAPGCSEDGQTAACPPFELYNIGAAGERDAPSVKQARAAAVDAGCMSDLGDAATETP